MRFGEFSLYDAAGVELTAPVKCNGRLLKAGHILDSSDIADLRAAGLKKVVGAQFDAADIKPETAADILLKSVCGDFLRYTVPNKDGYSALYADKDGVFVYDTDRLLRFNAHSEQIALAVLSPYTPVYKGQFLGNLRLFGPAVHEDVLNEAVTKISGIGSLLKICAYEFRKIAYIQTQTTMDEIKPLDELEPVQRFGVYGFDVIYKDLCEHSVDRVENAVRNAMDAGAEIVFVQSADAPADRNDIVPKAFMEASADIERMNWPLDAGIALVMANRKDVKMIGFAAIDFQRPAFDRLLRFLATKSLPAAEQFPLLAQGSLSLERMVQHLTDEQMQSSVAVGKLSESDKIAVVVLAAGAGRRMPGTNKLLETVGGQTMIEHAVEAALMSKAEYVAVVTGHDAQRIERKLAQYDVKIVRNADYSSGVLGSIRLGLSVLPPDVVGAVVLPADMPAFQSKHIDGLIDLFDASAARKPVVMPSYDGVRHNPVLWPRDLFKDVKIIPEDSHWTPALIEHTDYIVEMKMDDDLPLTDINTFGDMSAFLAKLDYVAEAEKDLEALLKKP